MVMETFCNERGEALDRTKQGLCLIDWRERVKGK